MIYAELLALSYFKNHQYDYSLSTLRESIGASESQFAEILDSLFASEFLEYSDNLISLTEQGVLAIVANNMECFSAEQPPTKGLVPAPTNLEEPFFPERFIEMLGNE